MASPWNASQPLPGPPMHHPRNDGYMPSHSAPMLPSHHSQQQPPQQYPPQQQQQPQGPSPGGYPPQQQNLSQYQQHASSQRGSWPNASGGGPPPQGSVTPPPTTPAESALIGSHRPVKPTIAQRNTDKLERQMIVTKSADEETEDGRIRNREAMAKIRDNWIYKQIRSRQDEFTQYKQARLFIGTWNVNAKGKDEPLEPWICADWGPYGEYAPDIVAVGFQEIVDLNAVNVAVDNKTQQRSQFWLEKLRVTLNSHPVVVRDQMQGYALLMQRSMVGVLACVFVKAIHRQRVKHVHSSAVGVGVGGFLGNKGGVSIRLQFYDSTICFVTSHLAANRENVSGRNADFANVSQKTTFDIGEEAIREVIRSGSLSQWSATGTSTVGLADHDLVFWLGDLNYRIDDCLTTEKVLELAEKNQLDELRALDQLNLERANGRVFQDFEEGYLRFPPTYKYQPGTEVYEQRPDKKLRAPAWCDRILWMAHDSSHVQQLTYNRSEAPNCSDHKPVYSTMSIVVKDVIQQKREAIYEEVMQLLDRFENSTLPMVGLDRVSLDFGEIRYDESVTLPIRITNTGKVVAQFRLVPKLDDTALCKPWMSVTPTYGMLIPGEAPSIMNFTITISKHTAQMLSSGRDVLDDILILRLEDGRDYYITVKATYARSCFGMSVDELILYKDPIRTVPLDPVLRADKYEANPTTTLCVPKELWRLIDAIYEKGLREPELFVATGVADEVKQIRECLDTGTAFGRFHVHSIAEALLSFLSSLSSPIVPPSIFPTLEIDSQNIQFTARRFLEDLPPIHYNVFVYVISFFREALLYKDHNLLTAPKLARICCDCMVVGNTNSSNPEGNISSAAMQRRSGMQLIIIHLLETSSI